MSNLNDQGVVKAFITEYPKGVIETLSDGKAGVVALVWKDGAHAEAGRRTRDEALAAGRTLPLADELGLLSADAVGHAVPEGTDKAATRAATRGAVLDALLRLCSGATGLPEALRAMPQDEVVGGFDLRGPGSLYRTRIRRLFEGRPFERKSGQDVRPATGGQRIFVAHLLLRAGRSWEEIKTEVAALENWGDVDRAKEALAAEIALLTESQAEGEEGASLPTLKQWLLIGDRITDRDIEADLAEVLWGRALTREGAEEVLAELCAPWRAARQVA